MANRDVTYCNGKDCALREQCRRYVDGQRIMANAERDEGQYYWMDHCNVEIREGYVQTTE